MLLFVGAILTAIVIYAVVLTFFMIKAQTDKPENPDAVIVLGCKVNGNTPSRMLKRRLDSAVIYLNENEDVVCIVSGGKGEDEKISEAQAMKEYLVDKGIDEGRILTEDKSVNTLENIKKLSCSAGRKRKRRDCHNNRRFSSVPRRIYCGKLWI